LEHRRSQHTRHPHVIVTKVTKTGREPASAAYLSHILDSCGLAPRTVRSTRVVDPVNTMDPKLVAVAFGTDPEAAMIYLADHVDPTLARRAWRRPRRPDHERVSTSAVRLRYGYGRPPVAYVSRT
jgi:hypothetical protein